MKKILGTEFCDIGQKVQLREDVLQRDSRKTPAYAGYSPEQFAWRKLLDSLRGKTGVVERHFPQSSHLNVRFGETLIGIDCTELVKVS